MAQFIKHVGVNINGKKVVVVFREVPNEPESALVIPTETLPPLYCNDLIKAIEHINCQAMLDPSEFLFRQTFHDGTNMLNTIHQKAWMIKVPTKSILMVPSPGIEINLVELNKELKGIANAQAAAGTRSSDIANAATPTSPPGVIDDLALASKYRSQATTFQAEAQRLLEEAEKLDPKGQVPQVEVKRGRGRPAKVQVV
jgi:hypothetical protein